MGLRCSSWVANNTENVSASPSMQNLSQCFEKEDRGVQDGCLSGEGQEDLGRAEESPL